jgi:hypothetical protein
MHYNFIIILLPYNLFGISAAHLHFWFSSLRRPLITCICPSHILTITVKLVILRLTSSYLSFHMFISYNHIHFLSRHSYQLKLFLSNFPYFLLLIFIRYFIHLSNLTSKNSPLYFMLFHFYLKSIRISLFIK